jgi:DNA-binding IclR family transcriptional regulator
MPTPKATNVPAVERAFQVLELLAQSSKGFSLSELSRRLHLPKSSVHLIVTTLERLGYLQKHPQTGHYLFGLKLFSLSRVALQGVELRAVARPWLEDLMKRTGLTVHLGILEHNEAVILEKIEAPGLIKVASWVGRRMDVNCTGIGKALLAFLPETEFDSLFKPGSLPRHNENTIVSIARIKREIAQIRALGFALDDEEDELGVRCIGAPLLDSRGAARAAISIVGTLQQIPLERVEQLGALLRQTADEIASLLRLRENLD